MMLALVVQFPKRKATNADDAGARAKGEASNADDIGTVRQVFGGQ